MRPFINICINFLKEINNNLLISNRIISIIVENYLFPRKKIQEFSSLIVEQNN